VILAAIGAGGMGEVCRARDTRLGRDDAIKVLPEAIAQDTNRLAHRAAQQWPFNGNHPAVRDHEPPPATDRLQDVSMTGVDSGELQRF
jgi:serine/threonine protein kinase